MDGYRGQRGNDYYTKPTPVLTTMKGLPSWINRQAHMSRRSKCVLILPFFALLGLCLQQLTRRQSLDAYNPYRPFYHFHPHNDSEAITNARVEDYKWVALENRSPTTRFRGALIFNFLRRRPLTMWADNLRDDMSYMTSWSNAGFSEFLELGP